MPLMRALLLPHGAPAPASILHNAGMPSKAEVCHFVTHHFNLSTQVLVFLVLMQHRTDQFSGMNPDA
jgi:hypothetical protein